MERWNFGDFTKDNLQSICFKQTFEKAFLYANVLHYCMFSKQIPLTEDELSEYGKVFMQMVNEHPGLENNSKTFIIPCFFCPWCSQIDLSALAWFISSTRIHTRACTYGSNVLQRPINRINNTLIRSDKIDRQRWENGGRSQVTGVIAASITHPSLLLQAIWIVIFLETLQMTVLFIYF